MKYLIMSQLGLSLFIVPRLNAVSEVEKIWFYNPNTENKDMGKNLNTLPDWNKLEMITDYAVALNNSTKEELIIVIDDVGMGNTGDLLRKQGYKVIGGGIMADKLETDRQFATELMKRVMDVPESTSFTDWNRAIEFVKTLEPEDRTVFKPNDADVPKEYTYVSKNVADMVSAMQEFRQDWKWKEDFQIQRFVKGQEVDFNGYFNGKDFINLMIYFENKPIMNDDIGPASGGSIAVQFTHPMEGVFMDILNKLRPVFQKDGYVGCVAINSIVCDTCQKPHFIEFTNRFGYPSLQLDISLIEDKGKTLNDLFKGLLSGDTLNPFAQNRVAAEVSVSVSPYPSKDASMNTGLKIGWDRKYDQFFFPAYIMAEKNYMVLSGTSNECLSVTAVGDNLDGTVSELYDTYMKTLKLKNSMYRSDCGISAKKRIKALHDMKLL